MNNPVLNRLIKVRGKRFDIDRKINIDRDARLFLLKRDTDKKTYLMVAEIAKSWFISFNDYRFQMSFKYATVDSESFRKYINITSAISYGTAIFDIDENRRDLDIIPPQGKRPFWNIYCQGNGKTFPNPVDPPPIILR